MSQNNRNIYPIGYNPYQNLQYVNPLTNPQINPSLEEKPISAVEKNKQIVLHFNITL
jgi:hypothetical protein